MWVEMRPKALSPAAEGRRACDQPITTSPSDHSLMLIAFYILSLTYLPWPSAGAIWPRSTKTIPGTDEFHEYAKSSDSCTSVAVALVPGDRRAFFAVTLGSDARGA